MMKQIDSTAPEALGRATVEQPKCSQMTKQIVPQLTRRFAVEPAVMARRDARLVGAGGLIWLQKVNH